MESKQKIINNVIDECCGLTKDTNALIISDNGDFSKELCELFCSTVSTKVKSIETTSQTAKKPYEKTEVQVVDAVQKNHDIVISLMSNSIGKIKSALGDGIKTYLYNRHKIFLSITSLDYYFGKTNAFFEAIDIDHSKMHENCVHVAEQLTKADSAHVKTDCGTDVSLDISGRNGFVSSGLVKTFNAGTNLPGGEAYIAPLETKTNGKIVIDTTINYLSGRKRVSEPVEFTVKDGFVVDISGGSDAQLLAGELEKAGGNNDKSVYCIAELGIGLNEKANIIGNTLIDEKVLGTCHFALGNNTAFGGQNSSPIHADMIVNRPKIFLDNQLIKYPK
ncbi:MAG: aminopeptidase [Candidatus Diapherotrites archaeon]|nr:aminopeptidase [Candidatus Diapherotrites archaeon]